MLERISIKNMSREEWLSERRRSIGGSDAPSVLGIAPFDSAFSLWCDKTGRVDFKDISSIESVRLGRDLENYTAKRFCEKTGKRVRRCNYILRSTDYPFAHASPDRLVYGERAGLECKTTSSFEIAAQLRSGRLPAHWRAQCVHYMMVTGCERWYLAALCFGSGFYDFVIERNEEEIRELAEKEALFWEYVRTSKAPQPDGSEASARAISELYPKSEKGKSVELIEKKELVDTYLALSAEIGKLKAEHSECENQIKELLGDAENGSCGDCVITWKTAVRKSFDKAAYEKAHGTIPEEYYKTTDVRSFRVRTVGAEPGL